MVTAQRYPSFMEDNLDIVRGSACSVLLRERNRSDSPAPGPRGPGASLFWSSSRVRTGTSRNRSCFCGLPRIHKKVENLASNDCRGRTYPFCLWVGQALGLRRPLRPPASYLARAHGRSRRVVPPRAVEKESPTAIG